MKQIGAPFITISGEITAGNSDAGLAEQELRQQQRLCHDDTDASSPSHHRHQRCDPIRHTPNDRTCSLMNSD